MPAERQAAYHDPARRKWTRRAGLLALGAVGLVLALGALADVPTRAADGGLTGGAILALAVVAGLALCGALWGAGARSAGLWLALAIVGQAAALQLVEAGPFVRYQHYLPPDRMGESSPWLYGLLGFQTLVTAGGLIRIFPEIRARLAGPARWRWALLVGFLVLSSATLSRDPAAYASELVLASLFQAVSLGCLALFAFSLPPGLVERFRRGMDRVLGPPGSPGGSTERRRPDRFSALAAGWVVLLAACLSIFSYERHPHVPDEVGYLFHARYFAAGMLEMPAPPVQEGFEVDLMAYEPDRWYSPVPPGWPAMLSLGVRLGAPWLVNPALAGLAVVLAYLLLWGVYDRRTARIAVLLLCASPWFIFLAMTFMTHTSGLVCALGAALAVQKARSTGRAAWALLGGSLAGVVGLIRPLEAVAVGGLLFLWLAAPRAGRIRPGSVAALVVGAAAVGSIVLPYNGHFTGSPTTFPLMAYFDTYYGPGVNDLGFGPDRGLGWAGLDPFHGHGAVDVAINANLNNFALNIELFGWATGSLLLAAGLVILGGAKRRDGWMVLAILVVIGLYSLYWFSGGPDFGPRYWYMILIPCVALSARGAARLIDGSDGARAGAALTALCLGALVVFFPWRAIDKYHGYRGMRPDIRQLAAELEDPRSLVLIRGERHPDYGSAAIYNPIPLADDAPIIAWDRSPEVRARLLEAFPDRTVVEVEGPSVTGEGFRIVVPEVDR